MEKYEDANNGDKRVARVKVYNKSVHLLISGQFKKWLTMDLDKLLTPEQAFYMKKVQPSQNDGLSRIEVSLYFESEDEWNEQVTTGFTDAISHIDRTLAALNRMGE